MFGCLTREPNTMTSNKIAMTPLLPISRRSAIDRFGGELGTLGLWAPVWRVGMPERLSGQK